MNSSTKQLDQEAICDVCDFPILGIRYKCSTCDDYDLCELCESENLEKKHHQPAHLFIKIYYPLPDVEKRPSMVLPVLLDDKALEDAMIVHKEIFCSSCQGPIIGSRFICLNCPKVDLCEKCEIHNAIHPLNHLCLKTPFALPPRDRWPDIHLPIMYCDELGQSGSRKLMQDRVVQQNQKTILSSDQFKKIICDEKKITLREMTEEDIDDVMLIETEAFFEPYHRSFFKKALYKNHVFLIVAERELELDEKDLREACLIRKNLQLAQYYDSDEFDNYNFVSDTCQTGTDTVPRVVAGYIVFWIKNNEISIVSIAVAEHSRGRGIGSRFMNHVVEWAVMSTVPKIYLHVSIFNKAAQQLYHKFGFKPAQYLDNYYRDENEDAILMCWDNAQAPHSASDSEDMDIEREI